MYEFSGWGLEVYPPLAVLEVRGKNEGLQAVSSLLPSARSAPSDST
jgi:hypothetical protein